MTIKFYLTDIDKIDYAFWGKDLNTISFELMKPDPIIDTSIMIDIDTILKFKEAIDNMLELRKKKLKR
ncbi:hypothetical protein LCGC14_0885600 [marine sediment metagenome]|uniref:Uncharacterized protein n=1 Tax=marine sediment metagenome TaxID=412755 RepID=A0A0F9S7N0_9ZZZZ